MGSINANCCSDDTRVDIIGPRTRFPAVGSGDTFLQRSYGVASRQHIYNQPGGREIDELADEQEAEAHKKKNIKLPLPNSNQNLGALLDKQETPNNQTPINHKFSSLNTPTRPGKSGELQDIDDKFEFSEASVRGAEANRKNMIEEEFAEISQVR